MGNNRGISMIELAVVMIILILIAGLAIYNGTNTIQKAEATELYVEMTNVVKAVNGVAVQRELEKGGENWIRENGFCEEGDTGVDGMYNIFGMNHAGYETSELRKKLDLETVKRDYIVNYDTGEVFLANPVEVFGHSVRTYESVKALVESEKI